MRAVVQRVQSAEVRVDDEGVGRVDRGLLVYLGAAKGDSDADVAYMADKIVGLRIFSDDEGKMSQSVLDIDGEILVISQFTLFGDVRKGRRPSFIEAEEPVRANELYEAFVQSVRQRCKNVQTGRFRASMKVHSIVDGPVTIQIDSGKLY
ncbi:MAG: D-aminoacyl-tRNA deacylase [Polyangiales bacterium]